MSTYLAVLRGNDLNARFPLNRTLQNRIGRGLECQIQISDPLASRVHAIVEHENGQWKVSDSESRNGTLVNGSRTDSAVLTSGHRIRIGNTEFRFVDDTITDDLTLERINQSHDLVPGDGTKGSAGLVTGMSAFEALRSGGRAEDLSDLHQLSLRCISISQSDELARMALEVMRARTHATVAAFLIANEYGGLDVHSQIPSTTEKQFPLSDQLTDMVCKHSQAVWLKKESKASTDSPKRHYADAICVPLIDGNKTIGAVHLYREKQVFEAHAFDFAIAAASILSAALIRARSAESLRIHHDRIADKNAAFDELLGESDVMLELKERLTRVARASGCILIRGESGSGKELVARAIHRASPRAKVPMLSVNCAAIPSELMESQLFGHMKGAFTGADKDHIGWFQQANNGTLFLDEIGEMTLDGQAKLLRILEGHPFLPVGGRKEIRVDVRVIAATNRDLREFVAEKRFREDLFYRLSVFEILVPPLRQRGGDIGLLIDHFFDHFSRQHGRSGLKLSPSARSMLLEYGWPGNVRQLRNVIDSAVVLAVGNEIRPCDLTLHEARTEVLDTLNIEQWEQRLIREALRRTRGNIPEASELLGISRATLYRKLETYAINREELSG
ncbi:MAG: sigma 54-interacting transcriptional regulator [Planctomycetota bacterium]